MIKNHDADQSFGLVLMFFLFPCCKTMFNSFTTNRLEMPSRSAI